MEIASQGTQVGPVDSTAGKLWAVPGTNSVNPAWAACRGLRVWGFDAAFGSLVYDFGLWALGSDALKESSWLSEGLRVEGNGSFSGGGVGPKILEGLRGTVGGGPM